MIELSKEKFQVINKLMAESAVRAGDIRLYYFDETEKELRFGSNYEDGRPCLIYKNQAWFLRDTQTGIDYELIGGWIEAVYVASIFFSMKGG